MNSDNKYSNHVINEIRSRIKQKGKIPFSEFMDLALYFPGYGYYCGSETQPYQDDYYTSPSISPVFGACIAIQLRQMWLLLDKPAEFTVVEMGSGNSNLFCDITRFATELDLEFAGSLEYFDTDIYDRVPSGITGCVLSNELVDAFPVARFRIIENSIHEIFVALDDDNQQIIEVTQECLNPKIKQYLASLESPVKEGFAGEFNIGIDPCMEKVSGILDNGFVITFDYGGYKDEIYSQSNSKGTLQTYYKHVYGLSPYQKIGEQDITTKVDFSRLIDSGFVNGIATVGLVDQSEFLTINGINLMAAEIMKMDLTNLDRQENLYCLEMLRRSDRLGGFKVLIQSKDQEISSLENLRPLTDQLDVLCKNPPIKGDNHISIRPNQYLNSYFEIYDLFEDPPKTF